MVSAILMEGQHAVTVVFLLVICFVNGQYIYDSCFEDNGLKICPSPIFIRKGKLPRVDIECSLTKGVLHRLRIGVTRVTESSVLFLYTIKKEKGQLPEYVHGSQSFTPDSKTGYLNTDTSLTLVLHNVSVSDLRPNWFCYQQFKLSEDSQTIKFEHPFAPIRAMPYPVNTTLTVTPTGGPYSGDSIINLHCRGYYSFNFKVTSQRRLQTRFEYQEEGQWKLVEHEDGQQAVGIVAGAPVVDGDYVLRTYTLKLRVSSIPDCTRRYRCLHLYESTHFANEAAYTIINVQVCTGNCMPVDACDHKNITTNNFQANEGILLKFSLAICSALLLLLIVILFFIQKHRRKMKRKKSAKLLEQRRASLIRRQSLSLRPTPVNPNEDVSMVSEPSLFYSTAPTSTYTYDSTALSMATDPTLMSSTSVDTDLGLLANRPVSSLGVDSRHSIRSLPAK